MITAVCVFLFTTDQSVSVPLGLPENDAKLTLMSAPASLVIMVEHVLILLKGTDVNVLQVSLACNVTRKIAIVIKCHPYVQIVPCAEMSQELGTLAAFAGLDTQVI